MILINENNCTGCGNCERDCPVAAIRIVEKIAVVGENCVLCGVCERVCRFDAVQASAEPQEEAVICISCPIRCAVKKGYPGACGRYVNREGRLVRSRDLVMDLPPTAEEDQAIARPLITAVGAGTNYPCCRPAPFIVQDEVNGVDVVTVVTEAPLSYSGAKLKVDTNYFIGTEGARVRCRGRVVGMIETEEYGSKMIALGGANRLTGKDGFITARTVVDVCNGERVALKVEGGAELLLQVGSRPIIDGIEDNKMRVGCGSATIGMFAEALAEAAGEAIILDHHVIGLLSEHLAGEYVGLKWSGVIPNARRSTRGRYFGEHGKGWGGTNIENPRDAIQCIDRSVATPGLSILITETTGQKAALFILNADYSLSEIPRSAAVEKAVALISSSCQEARVSAVYTGGTGGSARAGVTRFPVLLTEAVHSGEAKLTIGGAPAFILPGGGINFIVDVEKMVPRAFCWVPTPATVAPVEYTVTKEKYRAMGGHLDHVIERSVLKKRSQSAPDSGAG